MQSLPLQEKKKILKYYESISRAGHLYDAQKIKTSVLDYMMNEQLDSYVFHIETYNANKEFKKFNTLLDKTRKESFKEVFPMLSEWYDSI